MDIEGTKNLFERSVREVNFKSKYRQKGLDQKMC